MTPRTEILAMPLHTCVGATALQPHTPMSSTHHTHFCVLSLISLALSVRLISIVLALHSRSLYKGARVATSHRCFSLQMILSSSEILKRLPLVIEYKFYFECEYKLLAERLQHMNCTVNIHRPYTQALYRPVQYSTGHIQSGTILLSLLITLIIYIYLILSLFMITLPVYLFN